MRIFLSFFIKIFICKGIIGHGTNFNIISFKSFFMVIIPWMKSKAISWRIRTWIILRFFPISSEKVNKVRYTRHNLKNLFILFILFVFLILSKFRIYKIVFYFEIWSNIFLNEYLFFIWLIIRMKKMLNIKEIFQKVWSINSSGNEYLWSW